MPSEWKLARSRGRRTVLGRRNNHQDYRLDRRNRRRRLRCASELCRISEQVGVDGAKSVLWE